VSRAAAYYHLTPTEFLARPLVDVAFDLEVFRADQEAQAIELEKQRLKHGRG
jgi:hypothetical protein